MLTTKRQGQGKNTNPYRLHATNKMHNYLNEYRVACKSDTRQIVSGRPDKRKIKSIIYPCRGGITPGYPPKSKRNIPGEALNSPQSYLATILKSP